MTALKSHLPETWQDETFELLTQYVTPVRHFDDVYGDKIVKQLLSYILTGDNGEILIALHNRNDYQGTKLISGAGSYSRWYEFSNSNFSEEVRKEINACVEARFTLYNHLFERMTTEQIVRYAKTMVAITCEQTNPKFHDDTPIWFAYLLSDAFISVNNNQRKTVKNSWSLAHLMTLLQSEGADEQTAARLILGAFFERNGTYTSYDSETVSMCQLPDFEGFLLTYKDIANDFIATLSERGQKIFLIYFKNCQNKEAFTRLVAPLSLSDSKDLRLRELAVPFLSSLDGDETVRYLGDCLMNGTSKDKASACDYLARLGTHTRPILEQALAQEKLKSVKTAITNALARLDAVAQTENAQLTVPPAVMPDIQMLPDSIKQIISDNFDGVYRQYQMEAEKEKAKNDARKDDKEYYASTYDQRRFEEFSKLNKDEVVNTICAYLQGKFPFQEKNERLPEEFSAVKIIRFNNAIVELPEFGVYHALLIQMNPKYDAVYWDNVFKSCKAEHWQNLDLRQLVLLASKAGFDNKKLKRLIAKDYLYLSNHSYLARTLSNEQVYPFFVENAEFLQEAFGVLPQQERSEGILEIEHAIRLLYKFPSLPQELIAPLLELALGDDKKLRLQAQKLLEHLLPNAHTHAINALKDGKQDIRMTAIRWLARLNDKSAIAPLYELLKKEKQEVIIAEILTALETLGEDISPYLAPEVLLKNAEKGLKGKISSSFGWFNFEALPEVFWKNGDKVHPDIIKWWVMLAEKAKDPRPNPLFIRYLELLDKKSQHTLSLHLLQVFIIEDTRTPTLEEASVDLDGPAQVRWDMYQSWYKKDPVNYECYGNITIEQIKADIIQKRMSCVGSAIKSKGLLALTVKTQGTVAVQILQDFMKNHYLRRSQIEAMLTSFSASDDPSIIQLLLSVSRRYKTEAIQLLARVLVNEIAERNGWTADELADRTIPTAGFDDDGILRLEYGSRTLIAYIDDNDKFVLKNEEGKVIKSLPTPRADDDKELIKEAKAVFSIAKREYKQVLTLQTTRLYESMCGERLWTSSDWQEYLHQHPLMKRLVVRLVWLELDETGAVVQSFRPADDGTLLNLDDDEITLGENSRIKLAHRVLLDDETAKAWMAHFKDYKLSFLFTQMINTMPDLTAEPAHPEQENDDATINTFKGYLTDTYTLRGMMKKLGYVRSEVLDGGRFDSYEKPFGSLRLSAVIEFSGSYLPEEDIPAVLYGLSFNRSLAKIPSVLLAECFADYQALANKTQGFDEDWSKKTLW